MRMPTPLPNSTPYFGASLDPALRVLSPPSRLTGLCPGQKLKRGQEQAEAGPRLAHAGGGHAQGGGAAAGRGDSTGSVHALAAAGSTRDQQETAPDPALASPCDPAPGQAGLAGREVADSWWGELGKFMLSADWSARGGALGRALGPSCPTPPWRKRITPTQP